MNNAKNEYNKRLQEIELYFDTLQFLDQGNCSIKRIDILGKEEVKSIDLSLTTILKANGFLLLYNLIEATIRNSINAVLASIHSSRATFRTLSDNLKKIWINQESKNTSHEKIMLIAETILKNEMLKFEKDCINISGNIDARRIREILRQFGGNEIGNGRDLQTIKDKRNKLAHGEFTFSEIGQDCTMKDLILYKQETEQYLSSVLDEIQDYIDNKKYLSK